MGIPEDLKAGIIEGLVEGQNRKNKIKNATKQKAAENQGQAEQRAAEREKYRPDRAASIALILPALEMLRDLPGSKFKFEIIEGVSEFSPYLVNLDKAIKWDNQVIAIKTNCEPYYPYIYLKGSEIRYAERSTISGKNGDIWRLNQAIYPGNMAQFLKQLAVKLAEEGMVTAPASSSAAAATPEVPKRRSVPQLG